MESTMKKSKRKNVIHETSQMKTLSIESVD